MHDFAEGELEEPIIVTTDNILLLYFYSCLGICVLSAGRGKIDTCTVLLAIFLILPQQFSNSLIIHEISDQSGKKIWSEGMALEAPSNTRLNVWTNLKLLGHSSS